MTQRRSADPPARGPAGRNQQTCQRCGRTFACLAGSVADRLALCLRCFDRHLRYPGLCQRP